jgi:hypothetical protein
MLKKIKLLPLLILLTAPVWGQKISKQAATHDWMALKRILNRAHPQPYDYISEGSLQVQIDSMLAQTGDSISLPDFEWQVRFILSQVGCGHTYMAASGKKIRKSPSPLLLPIRIHTDGERLWVAANLDTARHSPNAFLKPGVELLSIGDQPVGPLVSRLRRYQPADGYNGTFGLRILNKGLFFSNLYVKFVSSDSLQSVRWRDSSANVHTDTIRMVREKFLFAPKTPPDTTLRILAKGGRGAYRFYFHPKDPKTGVIEIRSFAGGYPRFYRKAMRELRMKGATSLVIDVRDNLGGSFHSCVRMTQYVADKPLQMQLHRRAWRTWKHQPAINYLNRVSAFVLIDLLSMRKRRVVDHKIYYKLRFKPFKSSKQFKGKVVVLVNGWSFSASSLMATYIKENCERATIIGTETGGGAYANNGMQIPIFRLPESRFKLRVPMYHLNFQLGPNGGHGVMPDIVTRYTIDDVIHKRDLDWEAVWKTLNEKDE